VVVEGVAKNSEGEKAGLAEGDTILSWTRGDANGRISSPFDLTEIETEQEPRGRVTLEGTRGGAMQTWVIGPDRWDIQVRPSLPPDLLTIYREGQELARSGKFSDAEERWRAAAADRRKYQCEWLGPWVLFHGAEALAEVRQWKESDVLYQAAIELAADAGPCVRAQVQRDWAHVFQLRSDLANAVKYYRQADVEIQKSSPESLATADTLNHLGQILIERGDLDKAGQYFSQALEIDEKLASGSLAVASTLNNLGIVAYERGDLDQAEEHHRQSFAIREKLAPGSLDVAASLNNLGNVADERGNLAKSDQYYQQSLAIRERLAPGSLDVASTLNNLGGEAFERGDLFKAEEYHRQALAIREKLAPGSPAVATSLINLGNVSDGRGDLAQAEEYYARFLAIEEKLAPASLGVALALNNLGVLTWERGDLARAEEYYRQSLAIREKLAPGSLDVAATLYNLGNVAEFRGDSARAEEYFRQSLAIDEKIAPGSLDVAESLNNLGNAALARGDLAKAEEYYRQSLPIKEKLAPGSLDVAESLINLGIIAERREDLAKAEDYFQKSLTIQEKLAPGSLDLAETLTGLGNAASERRDLAGAERYYREALLIRKRLSPKSQFCAESLAALAGIVRDKHQPDEAIRLYGEALDVLDGQLARLGGSSEVRAGFRAKHADYYLDYAELLVTQKNPELAFQVLERSRARMLLELLFEAHVNIRLGAPFALLVLERLLHATLTAKSNRKIDLLGGTHSDEQLAEVNKEMAAVMEQYQEVEGQIRTSSPTYAALTQPQPLSAHEVQQELLDTGTVLLEYALGEKRSHVFVVTQISLDSYELPKRSKIEDAARHVYDLLTSRNRWIEGETSTQRKARVAEDEADYQKAVATLSQMILGPVAVHLEGKRLLIVADGALQYIPFAVLPVSDADASKPSVPLIAKHEIVNLPSASVLALLRRQANGRTTGPKEVAVLADPVFDKDDPRVNRAKQMAKAELASKGTSATSLPYQLTRSLGDVNVGTRTVGSGLPRLAFSRQEANAIMAMTDHDKGMEALDFQANRELALSKELGQYRIVHFATHGLLDNEHPELSGLVLSLVDSKGNPQNGFLELQDIYNLDLPVDLVVLSACETGLGKEISGEGLVGLTRGFMYAGAPRVVASLWKVDDVATRT
jgi:CHAT domain-containing protein/Tfp pilus assembly protein PilF